MSERAMRIRIGLFVLVAMVLLAGLVVLFSAMPAIFKGGRPYIIRFSDAPGVTEGTPVRRSGVRVGEVRRIQLDSDTGEVKVTVYIEPDYVVRHNDIPTLVTGLLGSDTTIEFVLWPQPENQPPLDRSAVAAGEELEGERAATVSSLLNKASDVVPTTQEALNDVRKSLQRIEKLTPLVEDTLKVYRDLGKSANDSVTDVRKTNTAIQETLKVYRDLGKSASDSVPDLRNTNATLQETLKVYRDLGKSANDSVPELRKTNTEIQDFSRSIRESVPEVRKTIEDVGAASRGVTKLTERVDVLIQANQDKVIKAIDNLNEILQRTAMLLTDENIRSVNATIRNTSRASERLPDIALQAENTAKEAAETMKEARETAKQARRVVDRFDAEMNRVDDILKNMQEITKPLAERSASILRNADEASDKLNQTLGDVRALFKVLDQSDGLVRSILTDPSLYQHLDALVCQIGHSLPRVDEILRKFEVFADKLARHPESLGIGGVVRPGNGLVDPPTPPGVYPR